MTATPNTLKTTMRLGKVAVWGKRRIHAVELRIELRERESCAPHRDIDGNPCATYLELSICADFWNNLRTDIVMGGQCREEVRKHFRGSRRIKRLCELWDRWHLNGLKAGTRAQENLLALWPEVRDYSDRCALLADQGLLWDNGYKYGTAWLVEPIPTEILTELRAFCGVTAS